MTPVIGIDLGTTNTVVAVVRDGQASALADAGGQPLIPSVVSFHPNGNVLVGRDAKDRRLVDAANTVYSIKRLIGRSWDSEEVRRARARFPFEMREGPGQAALVVARGETYTLPEISAFVLRKAKAVAEAALGGAVERAVITVPANFNDLQRAATKVAGRVAGLEVLRILNEPTAAALAYGFGKASSERLAVYDFGGGTFDVTLLDLSDNVFEVLATAGNTFLGGDDIDHAITDRMANAFLAQHRYDPRSDGGAFERLRSAAEQLKQRLSFEDSASVIIEELAHGPGGKPLSLEFALSRAELERLITPIIDRTFAVCEEALAIARRGVEDFDEVLLVGGSTRVPLVRRRVEEFFRRELKANISPDEVVAIGAAIQANALTGGERRRAAVPEPPAAARRAQPNAGTVVVPAVRAQIVLPSAEPRARMETIPGVPAPGPSGFTEALPPPPPSARAANRTSIGLGPPPSPAPQEESVRFALGDGDIQEIYGEDEITKRGRNVVDADDEPTHAGRANPLLSGAPLARHEATSAPLPPPPPPAPPPLAPPVAGALDRLAFTAPSSGAFGALDHQLPPLEQPVAIPSRPSDSVAPPSSARLGAATAYASTTAVPAAPLLVDVTPLTLTVETVRGFCDTVIARNTAVPCEQTREFVTAADGQTVVRVRVAQGESRRFEENTLLGEVELSGLRPMPRGAVQIAVTFALDTNGMLSVSAAESASGRATAAQLRLIGLPEPHDVAAMAARQNARHTL